ncbi:MAG: hypothetical protein K0Q95_2518 [Bacteroidota bacterium]|jgi:uncharacterized protein (TIGR02284 family)|nr:hypothetical protein [Bacteroidota bacterium]
MESNTKLLIDMEELSALQMDSINGFKQLAERIEHAYVRTFVLESEKQSTLLWQEINAEIESLHGDIKTQGTLKGAINHLWMKLKADVIHSDLPKVLENIKICEEFNISRYQSVLSEKLPPQIKLKLLKHLDTLNSRLKTLIKLQEDLNHK